MTENKIYSNNVLDHDYESLFKNKCSLIKEKYSENDLELISYETLLIMGKFLINVKPLSQSREYKKCILKYLDIYIEFNKPLTENKKLVYQNSKEYLYKVGSYLLKFGFSFKSTYKFIMISIIMIELILMYFFKSKFYFLPYFSITIYSYLLLSQYKKKKKGKLIELW